jgi:hypothetical protein
MECNKLIKGLVILFLFTIFITGCSGINITSPAASPTSDTRTLPTSNGAITYSASSKNVIVRTFYGGGNFGTLEFSPEISIYGDGRYILGPGLQMRENA